MLNSLNNPQFSAKHFAFRAAKKLFSLGADPGQKRTESAFRSIASAGVWFVDIPRTGSTSLKVALEEVFGFEYGKQYHREKQLKRPKAINDHCTAKAVRQRIGREVWNSLFTFTIVRNPWDRFYSLYKFRIEEGQIEKGFSLGSYIRLFQTLSTQHRFSPFVLPHYYRPMRDYIIDAEGKVLVTHVARFEEMDALYEKLTEALGIKLPSLKKHEVISRPGEYRKHYEPRDVEAIAQMYQDDIAMFGYEF